MVKLAKNLNSDLQTAKSGKNDEFYTQLTDIEKELGAYKAYFKDKIVFCNCDDPQESNFWRYFDLKFDELGLKKLVTTHYVQEGSSYKLERLRDSTTRVVKTLLVENGDFRSDECTQILQESDIVVTNPPFSLFREYIHQLISHEKRFVILGSLNAITYKNVFSLIKENKVWIGHSISSGDREFRVPESYPLQSSGNRIDSEGNKYIRVKGVRWFTNLEHNKRNENIILYKEYTKELYSQYDNYQAVEVGKVAEIPQNYFKPMGVPITFLDKYNPNQFEIFGIDRYIEGNTTPNKRFTIKGKEIYARIVIKRKGIL